MIRLSRMCDYGVAMLTFLARDPEAAHSASEIAEATGVPAPMASKILKQLGRAGLLASHRGVRGGYGLARPTSRITIAEIVEALDGPIALTACVEEGEGDCGIERLCPARANWQRINLAIRQALEGVTLADMVEAIPSAFLSREEREALERDRSHRVSGA
ncbi:Putative HTH-type transcriptional regulator [bacterium HR40]|nr:Putative HTH-type transcriptional regulator [bacterium HR40]